MPKKIRSFYWASDANCNELRVLRTRPNKLNSNSRIVRNFRDSFNSSRSKQHFRANKRGKLIAIEDFRRGFLNSEKKILKEHNTKLNLRSLGKSNRNSPTISLKKNIVSLNSLKKQHPNRMAVDFDHMYMDCGDSKISLGRDIELQHLKELSILNVELIQQQNDQIKAKDKIIKALQEEKKNLEARLERIERRLSLQLQKKKELSVPISIQTDFSGDSYNYGVKTDLSPKTARSPSQRSFHQSPSYSHKRQNEKSHSIVMLEEECLNTSDSVESRKEFCRSPKHSPFGSPLSPMESNLPSKDKRLLRKDSVPNSPEPLPISGNSRSPNSERNRKLRSPTNHKKTLLEDVAEKNKSYLYEMNDKDLIPSSPECEDVTDHSLRSRHKSCSDQESKDIKWANSNISSYQLDTSHDKISEKAGHSYFIDKSKFDPHSKAVTETPKVRGEGILTTSQHYYLPSRSEVIDVAGEDYSQVEIPQWRVKSLASLYVIEGTENLEDEIFLKRHQKPEYDERRRKRWDLQRMREQRQYEKLRERYECRNKSMEGSGDGNEISLRPPPEGASDLQVDAELPVCAFGQNLVVIPEADFDIPWISKKAAAPPVCIQSSKKKKK